MGNVESSTYEEEEFDEFAKFQDCDTLGYRVLGVQPRSPASDAGLVSFFDFLVGANGQILLGSGEHLDVGEEYDDVDFPTLCQEFVNRPLELLVWNIKKQEKRLVEITPRNNWGGAGLLGVTIRLDDYGGADERLTRVLEVEQNSPAAIAGLVPNDDYLLGTTADSFDSTSTVARVLNNHVDKVVEVYVYNTVSDVVRVVALMPTWSWGGNGLLGAEVGTGYLHRLPMSCRGTIGSSIERKVRWVGMKPVHPSESEEQQSTDSSVQQLQQHDNNNNNEQRTLVVEPQLEMEVVDDSVAPHDETHKTIEQVAAMANNDNGNGSGSASMQPAVHPTVPNDRGTYTRDVSDAVGVGQETEPSSSSERENEQRRNVVLSDYSAAGAAAVAVSSSESPDELAEQESQPSVAIVPPDPMTVGQRQPEAEPSAQLAGTTTEQDSTTTAMSMPPPMDAASRFAAPPPIDATTTVPTTTSSYASQMMPPPPMSSLSWNKDDGEVDLR